MTEKKLLDQYHSQKNFNYVGINLTNDVKEC